MVPLTDGARPLDSLSTTIIIPTAATILVSWWYSSLSHCRGLLALWRYMKEELGIDPVPVWDSIKDVVVKTAVR